MWDCRLPPPCRRGFRSSGISRRFGWYFFYRRFRTTYRYHFQVSSSPRRMPWSGRCDNIQRTVWVGIHYRTVASDMTPCNLLLLPTSGKKVISSVLFTTDGDNIFLPNVGKYVQHIAPSNNRIDDNLNFHQNQNLISVFVTFMFQWWAF
jgi:hypothetical protein